MLIGDQYFRRGATRFGYELLPSSRWPRVARAMAVRLAREEVTSPLSPLDDLVQLRDELEPARFFSTKRRQQFRLTLPKPVLVLEKSIEIGLSAAQMVLKALAILDEQGRDTRPARQHDDGDSLLDSCGIVKTIG